MENSLTAEDMVVFNQMIEREMDRLEHNYRIMSLMSAECVSDKTVERYQRMLRAVKDLSKHVEVTFYQQFSKDKEMTSSQSDCQ